MRYLAFIEFNFRDFERLSQSYKQVLDEREKVSDRFPKTLVLEHHFLEAEFVKKSKEIQAFWVFDTDDQRHLTNYRMHYAPYADVNFIPLTYGEHVLQAWMGWRR